MIHQLFLTGYKPLQLKPLYFGSEKCSPEHSYSGFRTHYILHLIYRGQGIFYFKGKRWELGPGDGFLILPGEKNKYVAAANNPWHYIWAAWEDPAGEMPERFSLSLKNPCIRIPESYISNLLSIFQSDDLHLTKQNRSIVWFSSLMQYLLEEYSEKSVGSKKEFEGKKNQLYGKKMRDFIHENYSSRINASDVTRHINLERSYASRIFKNTFNTGIYNYISNTRYNKACDLLLQNYSVKEICFSCGYSDYGNFLKTFRKISGLSPSEYRQRNKGL